MATNQEIGAGNAKNLKESATRNQAQVGLRINIITCLNWTNLLFTW